MEDFNEAMFKTKVDNIFVKLYNLLYMKRWGWRLSLLMSRYGIP